MSEILSQTQGGKGKIQKQKIKRDVGGIWDTKDMIFEQSVFSEKKNQKLGFLFCSLFK